MLLFRNYFKVDFARFTFAVAKPKKQKTFYQILEVPHNATPTNIKKNYLKLAKIYHPDVYKGADRTRFQKIQEAYKTLSSQGERNRYDQSIGLKSTYQSTEAQKESPDSDSTNQYGKNKNQFKYNKAKIEIDIDQEYQKFFKKKSATSFQQIRLHQPTEFKAMSQNERIRRRFTQVYNNPNLDWKMKYSKSYNQILDDQINQKNTHEQEQKKMQEQYEKKYTAEGIQKRKLWIKVGAAAVFTMMLPFIFSFQTKLSLERQAKEKYQRKVNNVMRDMKQFEIRQRMRFD